MSNWNPTDDNECDHCGACLDGGDRDALEKAIKKVSDYNLRLEKVQVKYNDLIMQVMNKHPDETRHETAKRYIYQAEHQDNPLPQQEEK